MNRAVPTFEQISNALAAGKPAGLTAEEVSEFKENIENATSGLADAQTYVFILYSQLDLSNAIHSDGVSQDLLTAIATAKDKIKAANAVLSRAATCAA